MPTSITTFFSGVALLISGFFGHTFGATILFPSGGGTGTSTNPTTNSILIGNAGGTYDVKTLTQGSNITITNSGNTVTIAGTASGLTAYDAWTHPVAGQSATTSTMILTTGGLVINAASSTNTGNWNVLGNATSTNATSTNEYVSNQLRIASLSGLLLGTTGNVSAIANGSASQILAISGGTPSWVSTSTFSSPLVYTGATNAVTCPTCLTANQSITLSGAVTGSGSTAIATSFGTMAQGVLANPASAATIPTPVATSTLYLGTGGQLLGFSGGQIIGISTTTAGTGLTYNGGSPGNFSVNTSQNIATLSNLTTNGLVTTSGGNGTLGVTANGTAGFVLAMSGGIPTWVATSSINNGVTSITVPANTVTGAITFATSSTAFNGLTASTTITNSAGTLTFTNTLAGKLGTGGGGTGTTTWMNGALTFYDSTLGTLSQGVAQASIFFDKTNSRLGIGSSSPDSMLVIASTTTATPAPLSNTLIHIVGPNALPTRISIDSYNSTNNFGSQEQYRRARGTAAAPTKALAGDTIGSITSDAYGLTGFHANSLVAISLRADGDITDTSGPTNIGFFTTASTSISMLERMTILPSGAIGIGTTTPYFQLTVSSSTGPQIAITDGSLTQDQWNIRTLKNELYVSTSSPSTFATSTVPALKFDTNGYPQFGPLVGAGTVCAQITATGGLTRAASACGTSGVSSLQQTNGSALTGALTLATSSVSAAFNGLTASTTITDNGTNTFTFTNSLSGKLGVAGGGTGAATLTGLLSGNGTSAITGLANGTGGQILSMSSGAPAWVATTTFSTGLTYTAATNVVTNAGVTSLGVTGSPLTGALLIATSSVAFNGLTASTTVTCTTLTCTFANTMAGLLGVAGGGTGVGTLASNGVLYGNGTGAVQATAQGAANSILTANAGAPSFSAAPTIGTSVTVPIVIGGTAVGSTLEHRATSGNGVGAEFNKFTLGNNGAIEIERQTESGVGIGTTTPRWNLTVSSSTRAQFALTDGSITSTPWTFRSAGGNLYIATSSATTFATSTLPFLSLIQGTFSTLGATLGIGTTTPANWNSNALVIGSPGTTSPGSLVVSEYDPATSTSMTVDWSKGTQVKLLMGSAAYTIAFASSTPGQTLRILTCNPTGSAGGAVTWTGPIHWAGGAAPTQTTTANTCDVWSFLSTSGTSTNNGATNYFGAQTANFQ